MTASSCSSIDLVGSSLSRLWDLGDRHTDSSHAVPVGCLLCALGARPLCFFHRATLRGLIFERIRPCWVAHHLCLHMHCMSIPCVVTRQDTFEGASARGEVSWVAPGVTSRGAIPRTAPDPKLCLNVASINHRTIKKWIGPKEP